MSVCWTRDGRETDTGTQRCCAQRAKARATRLILILIISPIVSGAWQVQWNFSTEFHFVAQATRVHAGAAYAGSEDIVSTTRFSLARLVRGTKSHHSLGSAPSAMKLEA